MRARYPDTEGYIERDGVRIFYEVFGEGEPTVLLLPTWSIIHSRFWKAQVPYLARHFRVITFDGRGNGRSDRPLTPAAFATEEFVADALAVMDATSTQRAVLVSLSMGAQWALRLAAEHADRVAGAVFIGASLPIPPRIEARVVNSFDDVLDTDEGWAKYNRHYWMKDYRGFLEFFFAQCFNEPHSTKQIEDCVGWGLETTPELLIAIEDAPSRRAINLAHGDEKYVCDLAGQVRCPVLVIHGDCDAITPHARGVALAEMTGGRLVTLQGSGHIPLARDPVKVNLLLRDFIRPEPPRTLTWMRGRNRQKRALYISSPIGLGHAQRDVAIAQELRKLRPDLQIDWLAQDPVTRVLEAQGERIHPASAHLASESSHFESESAEHDLHAFQALRRMDEILVANYMLYHDVVRDGSYDLVVGDEAWEVDYFIHENPEEKRTAYVWLTDFVGYLPMPDGDAHESFLTSDYNAEMIEHIERFPRLRDRAIFVGNPDDIVLDTFGDNLPEIRAWTERHYDFSGYITGFDPRDFADREALRQQLSYRPDEQVCIVTVGGSGVGQHLLCRIIAAFPEAKRRVPNLRMIVVTGPRIDPASLPSAEGLEIRAYVHELYRHLAACDLAVVQGGLTTCMELTANRRPFLYFPLRHHFEQNFHVRHRLERYHAGRCMDYETAMPEVIAAAIAEEIGQPVRYRAVETDGAARAAARIAELI
ncbi:MAG TPA: alpha/beta fold hydrolase [Ktedonobacterales bacterium]|nr:alpha/beta fold hydrolase [Ktedonobacterales bacterium]